MSGQKKGLYAYKEDAAFVESLVAYVLVLVFVETILILLQ